MPEHRLESPLDPALVAAGFSLGAASPGRSLYTADVGGAQEVLLTRSDDTIVLRTFLAPAHTVGYEQVMAVRHRYDGYTQDEFDGSWVLTERTSDYLTAEFPGWTLGVPDSLQDAVTGFVVARTIALARYGATVAHRLSALRVPLTGSAELTSHCSH